MEQPKCITDTLAVLQAERAPLVARVDAIDLALDNLRCLWVPSPPSRRSAKPRRAGPATDRRTVILGALRRSAIGLTIKELTKLTPALATKERSNTLNALKQAGRIRRAGNMWVADDPA